MSDCQTPSIKPLKVAVTTSIGHSEFTRLLPGRLPRWGDCDFLLNPPPGTECDYWIVFASSRDKDSMRVAAENTLFIAGEPPSKKIYPLGYYAQFHRVVSCHADDPHPRVTCSALGLPWHVGLNHKTNGYIYGYDELAPMPTPKKSASISVVCSNLTTTEGQRKRLEFLEILKRQMPHRVIHFGRGYESIDDKLDAILPHQFHLVLENSITPDYWTEKLADAYLGWAHPFYSGCPNVFDYFPEGGVTAIDISRPQECIDRICTVMDRGVDTEALTECRRRILELYNPFARFAYWAGKFYQATAIPQLIHVTSHRAWRPFPRGLIHRIKSRPPSNYEH